MKITAIRTEIIKSRLSIGIYEIIEKHLRNLKGKEKIIIAITSKIVAICEGNVVERNDVDKMELIMQEADYVLPSKKRKDNIILTLKNNILIPTAGIDESNGNGNYILWPKNPQKTANDIRRYLCKCLGIKNLGVIITDSKTSPMRRGTTGMAIAHSGFSALKNYMGEKDIFGRKLKVTKSNVADSLAAASVAVMGEGNEQTPLAVIEDISFIKFKKGNPSANELEDLKIGIKDDLYAPLFKGAKWKKCDRRGF